MKRDYFLDKRNKCVCLVVLILFVMSQVMFVSHARIIEPLSTTNDTLRNCSICFTDDTQDTIQTARELFDSWEYIIITREEVIPILQSFISWEITKGNDPCIVTTAYISERYSGYDLPSKIRSFLRETYEQSQYALKNVLLIGDTTDIPMRMISQDKGYGNPYTDFYYSELSYLDEHSWDSDGDNLYGEREDDVDLIPEIQLGRIPFSDPVIVSNILNNTMAFEQNNDSAYKRHMLLMGAFFWNDTDNAHLMEEIKHSPLLSEWTSTTLYEKNDEYSSIFDCDYPLRKEQVYAIWNNHPSAFVNYAGHGTPISVHLLGLEQASFLSSHDISLLKDAKPCVVFANACNNANPSYPNIIFDLMRQTAIACIGPSTVSQAASNWQHENDGSSQSFNYFFATSFLSGDATLSQAHQYALQEMNVRGLWYDSDFETYVWSTLYGIPDLSIQAIGRFPSLHIVSEMGGIGFSFSILNSGEKQAENISWNVTIDGGRNMKTTFFSGVISSLAIGDIVQIHIPVFGFGFGYFSPQPVINCTVKQKGIDTEYSSVKANIIGPYVQLI
jgi:hypothetical protein